MKNISFQGFPSRHRSLINCGLAAFGLFFLLLFSGCSSIKTDKVDVGYKLYIPNLSDATITVVPKKDSEKTELIDLEYSPQYLAKLSGNNTVYALLSGTNEISTIDSSDDTLTDTFVFQVGAPEAQTNKKMMFDSTGQKAYILTSYEPAGLAVMKVSDNSFIRGFDFDSTSIDNYFLNADGTRLYCTDPSLGRIYVVNTSTDERLTDIEVPESFSTAQYDPSSGTFFMAETGSQANVKIFDPVSGTFTQVIESVTSNIVRMTKSSDGKVLYVLGSDELAIVNLEDYTVDETVTLDYRSPSDFQFLPDKSFIMIPSSSSDLLMLLDPTKYTTEYVIDTGAGPGEVLVIQ